MKLINFLHPIETMKRVSREELAEKLDDLLEVVNKENVGFVITNEGKDDLVLCPAKWFDLYYDDDFGCIINSAVRYSLGRSSYMPSTTVKFVLKYLMVLDVRTITVMIEDIDRFSKVHLPERDVAMAYRYIDKLPLTLVGKVDYRTLENTK